MTDKPKKSDKKNFLTHTKGKPEPEPAVPEGTVLEAQSVAHRQPHEAALSGKMAEISSMRESGTPIPEHKSYGAKNKGGSTLPQAMARVHRKHQEDEIRERLQGKKNTGKPEVHKAGISSDLRMEDPDPGFEKSLFWFLFSFGRFSKGVLLVQSLPVTLLFWMLCGLGSILLSVGWLIPVAGPGPVYDSLFTSRVLAGGMLLGMGGFLAASLALFLILRKKFGGIGKLYGLKVVVNAFLPLALGQLFTMGYGTLSLGESYWRGNVPAGYAFLSNVLLPGLWIWGGYRVAQAATGLFNMNFVTRIWLRTGITLILSVPVLLYAADLPSILHRGLYGDWEHLKRETMASPEPLPLNRFDDFEKRIPFREVDLRRELYLARMQNLYRADQMDAARADALRLDRMAIPGSPEDELAKGLNYLFLGRLDLAIPRFQSAIALDPDCTPAHQWLALGLVATDINAAEEEARILMKSDPNVFHLQLLVRILFVQQKYQQIWDAMLTVNAPAEEWDPVTLYQGSVAAASLGKLRRSETLLSLARSKGLESKGE